MIGKCCLKIELFFLLLDYFFSQGLGEIRSLSLHAEDVLFVLFCFPNHFHMQSGFIASCSPWLVSGECRLLFVVKLITVG